MPSQGDAAVGDGGVLAAGIGGVAGKREPPTQLMPRRLRDGLGVAAGGIPRHAGVVSATTAVLAAAGMLAAALMGRRRWRRQLRAGRQPLSSAGAPQVRPPRLARARKGGLANGTSHAAAGGDNRGSKRVPTGSSGARGGGKAGHVPVPSAAPPPGPLAKLKPSATCVPLADGSAAVVKRPIAADNSCLFNAVGYCMHQSKSRAPFLRRVVSNEVSGDPDTWSDAFLGMPNARYCAWINEPHNWGGGIELAILAAHYRREVAAWNIETGEPHTFGEESGFLRQVMVIYNGVHYDALAITPKPHATSWEEDVCEFNPRTRRGRMILAAARALVRLNNKGLAAADRAKAAAAATGAGTGVAAGAGAGGRPSSSSGDAKQAVAKDAAAGGEWDLGSLRCGACGAQVEGKAAAAAHAAATGHDRFEQCSGSRTPTAAPQEPPAAVAAVAAAAAAV